MDDNQIEMKGINLFQWRLFKKSWMKLFRSEDPDIANISRISRFCMFRFIRRNAENYFCYINDKRAGLLSLNTEKGTEVFIYGVAVLPGFRKKGLGKYMMDFSEKRAKETKKKFMGLAVLGSNEPALNLYRKLDYIFVGTGVTPISISIDKITKSKNNSIRLETITVYTDEFKDLFTDIFLSQIKTVSQNDGVEYVRDNRIDGYHNHKIMNISKAEYQLLHVLDNDEQIGFLFCRKGGTTKSCYAYLQSEITLTIELLSNLAEKLKDRIEDNESFEQLIFRVFWRQADKLIDLQDSDFIRDSSQDKKLMFKRI